ncbi:MAG: DUF177 domain-containing protein [Amylibacter sp.]|nr:DUF177 domain-containing protein [Amylibacter sp.]
MPKSKNTAFDVRFSNTDMVQAATVLSAISIKKMRISGKVSPSGAKDWVLTAIAGATVTQTCVVTLKPVQTRVDCPIALTYSADYQLDGIESVTEMTTDENIEPLADEIDLTEIATEAIAMALPDYPKSPDAQLETSVFAAKDVTPMTDADTKPFASLASLKDKLSKEEG